MSDKAPLLLMLGLLCAVLAGMGDRAWASGCVVKREQRTTVVSSEDGEISAARLTADSINGSYLLHFFTLEPNSVFLPAVLHADMVFYVHTGSGKLSWTDEDDLKSSEIRRGDVYRVEKGSIFFIHSHLETETERQKLRIHAIFADSGDDLHEPPTGPYSGIHEMVLGFDRHVLQAAFQVPDDVIDELMKGTNPPPIVHALPGKTKGASSFDMVARSLLGNVFEQNKKKKKKGSNVKLFNLFKEDKDFENCNGWSTTVTRKKLSALKGTDIGLFMVNLTAGSMMGPHWNPTATEIVVVLQGRGMIRVVCSSSFDGARCRNSRFNVKQGDVFAVPRFHPMAHISFDNETLVFAGFTTSTKRNHPQFLAGQASVLRAVGKDVLAMSFNVTSTTLDQLLGAQKDSVILGCLSCAEEELRVMEEELQREREEAREREEEEARRQEEEARKREEEAKRKEEERRQREEEEAAAARREEQERKREREQAEAAKREEEEREAKRKREEEEEEKEREKQQEEERERQEEEERRKQQEEAAWRKEKEKERQKKEERRRKEEEAAGEEEETEGGRSEEEQAAEAEKREEATSRREEEEARRQEEEKERGGGGGGGGELEAENVGGDGKWRVLKRLSV